MKKKENLLKLLVCGILTSACYSGFYAPQVAYAAEETTPVAERIEVTDTQKVDGTISNVYVTGVGYVKIQNGGVGNDIYVNTGDINNNGVRVLTGGTLNTATIESGLIHVEGTAKDITINDGKLATSAGAIVDGIEMSGGTISVGGAGTGVVGGQSLVKNVTVTGGTITFNNKDSRGDTISVENAVLKILSTRGAYVTNITLKQGSSANIDGIADGLRTEGDGISISLNAGILKSATLNSGAFLTMDGGGTINNAEATDLTVIGATVNFKKGIIDRGLVSAGGEIYVGNSNVAGVALIQNYLIKDGGKVTLYSKGKSNNLTVTTNGLLNLLSGSTSNVLTIKGGTVSAQGGSTLSNTTISGGTLDLLTGSISDVLNIQGGTVSARTGSILNNSEISANGSLELRANSQSSDITVHESGRLKLLEDQISLCGETNLNGGSLEFVSLSNLPADISRQEGMFITANIDNLTGSGNIYMNTDFEQLKGDVLKITGSSSGDHKLFINNQGDSDAVVDSGQTLIVIETQEEGGASFTLAEKVEVGGYLFGLKRLETNDWALYLTTEATNAASAGVHAFSGGYLVQYAETQSLLQRMGDLRSGDSKSNVWARTFGGDFSSGGNGFLRGYDLNYWGFQVGADKKIELKNQKGDLYLGGFFGYTKGELDYGQGSGDLDSKSLGVYGSYMAHSGFYTDLVLKYSWMKNQFNVLDSHGDRVTGDDLKTDGVSASLEVGKRIHFNSRTKEGWYVEPQAQLSWGHQSGGTFHASNGLKIKADSYESILGRVGAHIGYEVKEGKNPINVYAKVSLVHEFDGDMNYHLNNSKESISFGDSWWTYGVGATAKLGDRHQIYFDIERAEGGSFTQDWSAHGGYRYSW